MPLHIFPKLYNIFLVALVTTIAGMLQGGDLSSVSAFLGQEQYRSFFKYPNSLTQGGITASMAGGSFLGSLIAGGFGDKVGRRLTIQTGALFWMIGAAIQCSAQNVVQLIFGRLIAGVGIGFSSSTSAMYCAECAPKKNRGLVTGLYGLSILTGMMLMFFIGYGCSFIEGTASFRTAWGIQIIPGFMLFVGVMFLPESPRWLANHDQWEEATRIVAQIHSKGDLNDPEVIIELEEMQEMVYMDKEGKNVTYLDLFRKDSINRTFVGISGQIWQQLGGMNVMMYYIVYVFAMSGQTGNNNLVSSSIQYVIGVVITIPGIFLYDRVGRRTVLLWGAFLMCVFLFTASGLLAVYSHPVDLVDGNPGIRISIDPEHANASKAVIACTYLFVASFSPTWGPCIWVYCSEIFPTRQRAKANGLCASFNWIFNFALALFVPTAFKNITWKTYTLFATFCATMFIQTYFMFPETKGKTLEEIEQMWAEKIPAWRSALTEVPDNKTTIEHIEEKDRMSQDSHSVVHQSIA
ncbi:hypothetical protein BABINDRAFT_170202 [Babjeviella inositovora NRRL Y-12698]|uniref:Major facilitator superfamily (MFS) profile domain-containing protein n=1 Tax=Babjeviella inositovora NRRL Y-12698 TaxID=984486 RepID=A0A1E3QZZ4_9ASCO|nr:uncharacterized protein BABINDRAFT_170202 [Babjeviella inositovora NRRL Y-12698]ODQ83218.1 hypothetical protein BABINDRAFT_170202 [Babjeviella inositovora NRRL Y-12698]